MKLEMYRGDSAVFNLQCLQVDGSPLDITTGDLTFTAKGNARDTTVLFQKTSDDGINVTNGPEGLATATLEPEDTENAFAPQWYKWDLQYTSTGGAVTTLLAGDLLLRPDISRST